MSTFRSSVTGRNLGAEERAVEEGHRCRLDRERHRFVISSDTVPGRTYDLTATGIPGQGLVVCCTCPAGAHTRVAPGVLPCKHAALVARRAERAGLAEFDGKFWKVLDNASKV